MTFKLLQESTTHLQNECVQTIYKEYFMSQQHRTKHFVFNYTDTARYKLSFADVLIAEEEKAQCIYFSF